MADNEVEQKAERLESEVREMNIKEEERPEPVLRSRLVSEEPQSTAATLNGRYSPPKSMQSRSQSPTKQQSRAPSPMSKSESGEEVVGGDITVKLEPGKPPKLSRTASQKIVARPPPLFTDEPDKTEEACKTFTVLPDCTYASKYLGSTEPALECDCSEEWDASTKTNDACGEDSDCINRATKMECIGDCGCGSACQNQRFQLKQYADVTVFKTEKKGYGLRANKNLPPNSFVFEYIGEVINEQQFRKRMIQYDEEGVKHFYFMSLSKGEFVDATKKGNLGRFCNHSCNPNCYVDKWVVGDKLRMGIFSERHIKAGEELVFNYNVDRYGADPQPCYCGEPNCTGFIGGKTQTERATKLSSTTIEALGIDDGDGWDTAVAKRPRKRKTGEDDEEYVNNVQAKSLDEDGIPKVMATLSQCKEKWIVVKLLTRIERADEEKVLFRVLKYHGDRIFKTVLTNFGDDDNIALQVLKILQRLPRLSRNKLEESKIEEIIRKLKDSEEEIISTKATELLDDWSKLEMAYRIPRMKRDPNAAPVRVDRRDRRELDRRPPSRSESPKSPDPIRGAPAGPRTNGPPRNFGPPRSYRPRPPPAPVLPPGWFTAIDGGTVYYYTASGETTWTRPTQPASHAPPPPPPKVLSHEERLHQIIQGITQQKQPEPSSASATPQPASEPETSKDQKWQSMSDDSKKKQYEKTIAPSVIAVQSKFKNKFPKEELKKLTKQIAKSLVEKDFKKGRVTNPYKIDESQDKAIKKAVQAFFDNAYVKQKERDKAKAEKAKRHRQNGPPKSKGSSDKKEVKEESDDEMPDVFDNDAGSTNISPDTPQVRSEHNTPDLKRKREDNDTPLTEINDDDEGSSKKQKKTPPPPPPPPPRRFIDDSPIPKAEEEEASNAFANESLDTNGNYVPTPGSADVDLPDVPPQEKSLNVEKIDTSATNSTGSPMQLATPRTNGSYENEMEQKVKQDFLDLRPISINGNGVR